MDALEQLIRERLNVLSLAEEEGKKEALLTPLAVEGVANFIKRLLEKPEG